MQRIFFLITIVLLMHIQHAIAQDIVQRGEITVQPFSGTVRNDSNGNPGAVIDIYAADVSDMTFESSLILGKQIVNGVKCRLYVYIPGSSTEREVIVSKPGYMPFHLVLKPGLLIAKKLYRVELVCKGGAVPKQNINRRQDNPSSEANTAPTPESIIPITIYGNTYGNMIFVKGGTFSMGSNDSDADPDEKPVHNVTLSNYYIGETEVTCGLWKAVMDNDASSFKKGNNYPVENVSYEMIVNFFLPKLNSLTGKNFRLPTEAEWEYAARGGKNYGHKYSGDDQLSDVAWYGYWDKNDNNRTIKQPSTMPVKTKKPNQLGLYDMSGNVWEWCSDWYNSDYYTNSPSKNPRGPSSQTDRVMRGGSWRDGAKLCRVSHRLSDAPNSHFNSLGFRLALNP